ncbi:N(2),N(2)-dimethylguanosine tRNA methyltransferase [Salinarchaeum sp. Harcht-Bsk1]|uniref:tRNA (guanine(26)-N(2))-dimethyltransferase n=1 Tax=Salinarchaeum sp. Harcht-Bsk1 TaxID=1333523 RepID=UPI000342382C|nr:tRNA (guanine(26)-N(2))-dimethyltransferase [Salinarchaeum sp. Harcht-Bsk1]AGN01104.1 N(2),N(2)-dimethylguanosine tRNA methyltransferase [Salinarchaeum sp. Harcht-Bsk1]
MEVIEGGVRIEVPSTSEEEVGDDVFYNPNQELNRDCTIAVLRAYRERESRASTYCDAMAASGIRGVRAAADGWDVTACDLDPDAIDLCERNFERNGLDADVRQRDANVALHESVHDVVDVDPYGSPIPFADAALSNARDLVCVTATDTAPLCGAHFRAGIRRYSTVPQNTEYHREMGLRVLVSALVRTAARYDRAARPILAHATRHYVRCYLELEGGAGTADDCVDELGHVAHCEDCLHRVAERGFHATVPETCPACGSERVLVAGPIWLGSLRDPEFVAATRAAITPNMGTADRARDLLEEIEGELDQPTHYDQHRLCKAWGRPASGMDEFLDRLRDAGFDATRAHYAGTAFKTDATVEQIRDATEV